MPHIDSAGPAIKKVPIMNPATAAERVEMTIAMVVALNDFLKKLLNPMIVAVKSNMKAAAVKPKNVRSVRYYSGCSMVAWRTSKIGLRKDGEHG